MRLNVKNNKNLKIVSAYLQPDLAVTQQQKQRKKQLKKTTSAEC